ncbi:hypothetical protein GW17_00010198 [Ensete ventricosum]|uniref:Uncharacterized protein n=1 Tax=Ensete ventricosum TaxID=4639 RepID=A0A444FS88_ENSVE|nr:hypothetical protein GW17_00010198 [Ensete ventricosum]RZR71283.1 hypothetical protein BHM03_00004329 [Ensete ventricosum]
MYRGITDISACRLVRHGSEAKLLCFRVGLVLWSDQLRRRNSGGQPLRPYTAFRDWSEERRQVGGCLVFGDDVGEPLPWAAQRSRPSDLRGPAYPGCRRSMGVARRKRRSKPMWGGRPKTLDGPD